MPGHAFSNDLRERIHHLSSMGFSGVEISTLLAISTSNVGRILNDKWGTGVQAHSGGQHCKLSRADIEVSSVLSVVFKYYPNCFQYLMYDPSQLVLLMRLLLTLGM